MEHKKKMETITQEIPKNGLEELTNVNHSETRKFRIPMIGSELETEIKYDRFLYLKHPLSMKVHLTPREIDDIAQTVNNYYKSNNCHARLHFIKDGTRLISPTNKSDMQHYFGNGNGNGNGNGSYVNVGIKVEGLDEKSERIFRGFATHIIDYYSPKK